MCSIKYLPVEKWNLILSEHTEVSLAHHYIQISFSMPQFRIFIERSHHWEQIGIYRFGFIFSYLSVLCCFLYLIF